MNMEDFFNKYSSLIIENTKIHGNLNNKKIDLDKIVKDKKKVIKFMNNLNKNKSNIDRPQPNNDYKKATSVSTKMKTNINISNNNVTSKSMINEIDQLNNENNKIKRIKSHMGKYIKSTNMLHESFGNVPIKSKVSFNNDKSIISQKSLEYNEEYVNKGSYNSNSGSYDNLPKRNEKTIQKNDQMLRIIKAMSKQRIGSGSNYSIVNDKTSDDKIDQLNTSNDIKEKFELPNNLIYHINNNSSDISRSQDAYGIKTKC